MGVAETSTAGTEEAGVVGTAETGAEGAAGIGAMGVARAVIPTPTTISSPSEVSTSGEISMQMKRKYNKKKRRGREIRTHEVRLGRSTPLFIRIRNSLFQHGCIIRILENVIDPSEDKSRSGPRVVELGMEEGVTTSEAPPFVAWEIAAKGSLVEITSGRTGEVTLV